MVKGESSESSGADTGAAEPATEHTAGSSGIFAGEFGIYRTATEDDYREVLDSGLIVLDTNVLLDLYRYHAKTREELIAVLRGLRGRVWVPNHAMHEFFRKRLDVIGNRAKELQRAIDTINEYDAKLEQAVRAWANRVSLPRVQTSELIEPIHGKIRPIIDVLIEKIREISTDSSFEYAEDTAKDPVIAALNDILADGMGESPTEAELRELRKIALQRIKDEVPPGWKDADKKENQEGDYLIWHQTLQEAKRRGSDVLFVTGDVKDDWWRREHGEMKGPLHALMREMRSVAGTRLFMMRPPSLLKHAGSVLGVEVSVESVEDAERVSSQDTARVSSHTVVSWNVNRAIEPYISAYTRRWRYTPSGFDIGPLMNLSHKSFSHQSYMRPSDQKLPAVRIGAFVACESVSRDELTPEHLRSKLRETLDHPAMTNLMATLTTVPGRAKWQSQPGHGRLTLEADLVSADTKDIPIASALLLMPESGMPRYGTDPTGAEIDLHIDLPVTSDGSASGSPQRVGLAKWHERFTAAFAIPEILARFLQSVGLTIFDEPASKFAVEIQARVVNQLGIEELIDFDDLEILTPRRYSVRFDGWAVADPEGKPGAAISKRFLTELCESVGRTGYDSTISALPD